MHAAKLCGRIREGDHIVSVDGRSTGSLSVDEVRNLIIGPQGSALEIGVRGGIPPEELLVTVVRGAPDFVMGEVLDAEASDIAPDLDDSGQPSIIDPHANLWTRPESSAASASPEKASMKGSRTGLSNDLCSDQLKTTQALS